MTRDNIMKTPWAATRTPCSQINKYFKNNTILRSSILKANKMDFRMICNLCYPLYTPSLFTQLVENQSLFQGLRWKCQAKGNCDFGPKVGMESLSLSPCPFFSCLRSLHSLQCDVLSEAPDCTYFHLKPSYFSRKSLYFLEKTTCHPKL